MLQAHNLYHGYDTKVLTMCVAKYIFNEADLSVINLLLTALVNII